MRSLRRAAPALSAYVVIRAVGALTLAVWAAQHGASGHERLVRWDAQWYAGVAAAGYGSTRLHPDGRTLADYAFFPLLPGLERVVAAATGLPYTDAGLVVSAAASVAAAWGIFAVADRLYGRRSALVAVVLWAATPVSIVQTMAYSESLFTALAAWSLFCVLTGRWRRAGGLAALAGLTRPVGAALAAAVVLAALVRVVRSRRTTRSGPTPAATPRARPLLGAALAPLGLLGYLGWVAARTGSATGYFDVAAGWGNAFDGGRAFAGWLLDLLTGAAQWAGLLLVAGLVLLGMLVVASFRPRQPLALLAYSLGVVAMTLTTSGYFGSKPRYLLVAFPLLFPPARFLARQRPAVVFAVLGALSLVSVGYGAVWLLGAGPP